MPAMPPGPPAPPGAAVAAAVLAACRIWPARTAVVELVTGRDTSYAALAAEVSRRVTALREAGLTGHPGAKAVVAVEPGDVEGVGTLAAVLACGAAGMVALVRNRSHPEALWRAQLDAAAAGAVMNADAAVTQTPARARARPTAAATCQLVATSGSTGTPKLVQLTDAGTLLAAQVYRERVRILPGEVVSVPQSLASVGALPSGVLPALLDGGTALLAAGAGVGGFLRALSLHDVVFAMAVTGWWQACLRSDALPDLTALRVLGVGGSPWHHLVPAIRAWLPSVVMLGNYGLTESHGPALQVALPEAERFGDVTGRPVGGLEVEIRDDAGRTLPSGTPGLLWLRGELITPGLLAPDAQPPVTGDGGGWLCTGDEASWDHAWVRVLGRRDDLVNKAGRKVYPNEVQAALYRHSDVADCAVVSSGGPPEHRVLGAFVVPAPGRTPLAPALRRWVREQVGGHAVPDHVNLVADLPLTGTGKVDRAALQLRVPQPLSR